LILGAAHILEHSGVTQEGADMSKHIKVLFIVSLAAMIAQTVPLMQKGGIAWWVEALLWAGWAAMMVRVTRQDRRTGRHSL
jgi:hypothetical protein